VYRSTREQTVTSHDESEYLDLRRGEEQGPTSSRPHGRDEVGGAPLLALRDCVTSERSVHAGCGGLATAASSRARLSSPPQKHARQRTERILKIT